jgi:hypothetical protein
MSDSVQVKLGAASAIVGALLGLVVNPLHGDLPTDPEAALARVAATGSWALLHLGIMASAVFVLGGLIGLGQVPDRPLARALAGLGVAVALPGAAVMLAGLAVDSFATKSLADLWAAAPAADKQIAFRTALAVEQVQNALFHTWAALFIGLPFVLMGASGLLPGGGFPRWRRGGRAGRRHRRAAHGRCRFSPTAGARRAVQPVRLRRDAVAPGRGRARLARPRPAPGRGPPSRARHLTRRSSWPSRRGRWRSRSRPFTSR